MESNFETILAKVFLLSSLIIIISHFGQVWKLVRFLDSKIIKAQLDFTLEFFKKDNFLHLLLKNDVSAYMITTVETWQSIVTKLRVLVPLIWPQNSLSIQFNVVICIVTVLVGNFLNVYVPVYNKKIVDSLSQHSACSWDLIVTYVFLKFLKGSGIGDLGVVNSLRKYLWQKVQQFSSKKIQLKLFTHLHNLPLKWHLSRKTGEVLSVMERGTEAMNDFLFDIIFSIVPTFVDIIIAIIYFIATFNVWFGLIVFSTMLLFVLVTIVMAESRYECRRRMNELRDEMEARSVDSLLNFETVKYYGAEKFEVDSYESSVDDYQTEEYKSLTSLVYLNMAQNVVISIGLLVGSLLCVTLIARHELSLGDYVLFASYIIQLYVPLYWIGTYYRETQEDFTNMEKMFDILNVESDIQDAKNAAEMLLRGGKVEFKNVTFGYRCDRIILKNISFTVAPGSTVAMVGPSGAGKSTIMRLLFRFYDVNDGAVLVDGQDVRTVTQASLRANIGVVPQDTVLFNNTVRCNIAYGRLGASTEDIIHAAKNADIHDRIMSFPDTYNTEVGERGLKLSGGEKQRIAIARTILKNPAIVLLDEATSALDTNTERNIQTALSQVCANRTTLIIAHRLSTIIHADEILVLNQGEIVERGNHVSLLAQNSCYASMWRQQLENNEICNADSINIGIG